MKGNLNGKCVKKTRNAIEVQLVMWNIEEENKRGEKEIAHAWQLL